MGRCLRSPAMHCVALRNTPAPHCRPLRNSTGKQCAGADFSDDPFLACISPPWPSVGADASVHPPTFGKLRVLHPWGRCLHRPALPATDLSVGAGFYPARPMAAAPLVTTPQAIFAPRRAGYPHPAAPGVPHAPCKTPCHCEGAPRPWQSVFPLWCGYTFKSNMYCLIIPQRPEAPLQLRRRESLRRPVQQLQVLRA